MDKKLVMLGIDVGGTNTVFGFVEKSGNVLTEKSLPTLAEKSAEHLFQRIFDSAQELFKEFTDEYRVCGIGVGAPNANYYSGKVENPPNLDWGSVDVVELVNSHFSLPVVITNDANACALGEMYFGAAKGMKDFIVITLGTGLGAGIVVNGHLVYGSDGYAGELGHVCVEIDGRQCACGNLGCLEAYVSATGIKRTVSEMLAKMVDDSVLRDISFNDLTSKKIAELANEGDPIALAAFRYTGKLLGMSLANFVAFSVPETIILFGGLAGAGELIVDPTREYMENHLLKNFKNKIKILPSGLSGNNSAVLGAAALAWSEFGKD